MDERPESPEESAEDALGRNVRRLREDRGWSQAELAERMSEFGVALHPSAIAKIEARDAENPRTIRFNEAYALARALEVGLPRLARSSPLLVVEGSVAQLNKAVDRATAALGGDVLEALDALEEAVARLGSKPLGGWHLAKVRSAFRAIAGLGDVILDHEKRLALLLASFDDEGRRRDGGGQGALDPEERLAVDKLAAAGVIEQPTEEPQGESGKKAQGKFMNKRSATTGRAVKKDSQMGSHRRQEA